MYLQMEVYELTNEGICILQFEVYVLTKGGIFLTS